MKYKIPRGQIYHKLSDLILVFIKACFLPLNKKEKTEAFKQELKNHFKSKNIHLFPYARTGVYSVLKAKSFPKNSEVIVPPLTIQPIIQAVINLGLKPVFVDISEDDLSFGRAELAKNINPKTKAIIITYLYGLMPNMDELLSICQKNNLFIIEDFSHNFNATWNNQLAGTFGDVGIYSTSFTKTFDLFGGAILVTNNEDLSSKIDKLEYNLLPPSRKILLGNIVKNLISKINLSPFVFTIITSPMLYLLQRIFPTLHTAITGSQVNFVQYEKLPDEWLHGFSSIQAAYGIKTLQRVANQDSIRIKNVKR